MLLLFLPSSPNTPLVNVAKKLLSFYRHLSAALVSRMALAHPDVAVQTSHADVCDQAAGQVFHVDPVCLFSLWNAEPLLCQLNVPAAPLQSYGGFLLCLTTTDPPVYYRYKINPDSANSRPISDLRCQEKDFGGKFLRNCVFVL